jgi:alkylated DNA repair protein (DNA oxidative demethylase)
MWSRMSLFPTEPAMPSREQLAEGAFLLRAFAVAEAPAIFERLRAIAIEAPPRRMVTPGGHTMSVAMTNCGDAGWTTDRRGYRYSEVDPETNRPWPPMPILFSQLAANAAEAAGYKTFNPDSCLINYYEPKSKMSLHQDKDERDFSQPIVSVSLGLPATFLFGGLARSAPTRKIRLEHGDVVVWGDASRMVYHGIAPLKTGSHPGTGATRINLTFRKSL